MKFFVDTAEIDAIAELNDFGMVDGVTTNPSLIKKSGRDIIEVTKEICELVSGPVSAEVTATDAETMIAEGRKLAEIADNIAVGRGDGVAHGKEIHQRRERVQYGIDQGGKQAYRAGHDPSHSLGDDQHHRDRDRGTGGPAHECCGRGGCDRRAVCHSPASKKRETLSLPNRLWAGRSRSRMTPAQHGR